MEELTLKNKERVGWREALEAGVLVLVIIKLVLNLKLLMKDRNHKNISK